MKCNCDVLAFECRANLNLTTIRHRVEAVVYKIDKDLLQLVRVGFD